MYKLFLKYVKQFRIEALLAPVMVVLEVLLELEIPKLMARIIDDGIYAAGGADMALIYQLGGKMVLYSVLAMLCGAASGVLAAISTSGFIRNLRLAMYERIQTYSFANMDHFEVPSLVTRMTKDMRELRMAGLAIVRSMFRSPVQLVMATYMVYTINPSLSRVFLVAVPVLAVALYLISHFAHPQFVKLMRKFDAMNASLEETFMGIRVVKAFVREDYEQDQFSAASADVRQQQRKAESLVILNGPLFNLVMYACMIAISYYGGQYIIGGTMTTGEFMSFLTYLRNILFSLMMLSSSLMQIVFAQASVDRANEVLNEQPDITDENADPALTPADGSIEFRDVCFKYSAEAEKNALDHIDLKIASGQTVGILGSTGSGKTTLVQLLPRLYDATSGTVLVGGHDVRDFKIPVLRKEVSMVLQKNQLFSGTIEENLKWGNPQATHQQVVAAAKVAQADDFITSFPKGYETELGQGGGNVSGGQKQRLCIARALLKEPKIIILDDSTSAVDTDTDKRIRKALKEDLQGMTTLIIAQRIASVMDADQIVVMDDGRIADLGTHEELLKRNAVYRDLFETQMKGVAE